MTDKTFWLGMGLGMVAGASAAKLMNPKPKKSTYQTVMERCIKNVGDVLEDVTEVLK